MATVQTNYIPFGPNGAEISLNQDGIDFDKIPCSGAQQTGKAVSTNSYTAGKPQEQGGQQINIVNAVDIDWNNAKLGDTVIKTTGQLLSYISDIANRTESGTPTAIEISFS